MDNSRIIQLIDGISQTLALQTKAISDLRTCCEMLKERIEAVEQGLSNLEK
jgi:hypothetical protein